MSKRAFSFVSAVLIILGTVAAPAFAAVDTGDRAPDFSEMDQYGKTRSLNDTRGSITVLEWVNPDCPFVKRHYEAGTMKELARKYGKKGVVWMAVNSTHYMNAEANAAFAKKHALPYPILIDADGSLGHAYGARTTPHIFIIAADGTVAYQGAIDSDPRGTMKASEVENHVEAALDALLAGKAPAVSESKPYGCSVKYKK